MYISRSTLIAIDELHSMRYAQEGTYLWLPDRMKRILSWCLERSSETRTLIVPTVGDGYSCYGDTMVGLRPRLHHRNRQLHQSRQTARHDYPDLTSYQLPKIPQQHCFTARQP